MENNELNDQKMLEMLIDKYVKEEETEEATKLKVYLINKLITEPIKYLDVIQLYYDIKSLNDK